jgi:hypothetical protein
MNIRLNHVSKLPLLLIVLMMVFARESFAQQGTLTDNATYPASVSALTIRGTDAPEGSADSFIKFKLTPDLPAATPGSFVAKATLTLYVGSISGPASFNVYRVTSSWAEGDTNAPTYDTVNPIAVGVTVTSPNSYVTVDLTSVVTQWLGTDGLGAGGVENFGVALVANTPATSFSIASKESAGQPARLDLVLNHAATADTALDFNGSFIGDVTGTKNATVVSTVGSQSAASVANSTIAVTAATDTNAPDTIVKRDAAGNFSAGTIAGSITGNAATATTAANATVAQSVQRVAQDSDIAFPIDGQVYYNTTSNVFKVFDATASTWKVVDSGAATTLSSLATINGNQVSGALTNATISGDRVTGEIDSAASANSLRLAKIQAPPAPIAAPGDTGDLSGSYIYRMTFVTNAGETEASDNSLAISVSAQQINLNIAVSDDQSVIARKLYRSTASDASIPMMTKLVTTIADNTTTTYTDDLADNLLGVAQPSVNTTGGFIYYGTNRSGILDTQTTSFGLSALSINAGLRNTAFGYEAMNITTTGSYNTAIGYNSMLVNTTGQYNSSLGMDTLHSNTEGYYNTAVGEDALWHNTSGFNNTGIGSLSLRANITGQGNTGIGYGALQFGTTAQNNTGVGTVAGRSVLTGGYNTFVGFGAGYDPGQKTDVTNSMALGQGAFTTKDNQVVVGNSNVVETLIAGNVGIGSDSPAEKLEVAGNLKLNGAGNGIVFSDGTKQATAAGAGTITGVTAGTGLTGGGAAGSVNLSVDQSLVAFQSDLAGELNQRQTMESSLQTKITDETNTRAAADTSLQGKITDEATNRTAQDTVLQNNINAEASTRAAAVTTVQNSVTSETNARIASNTTIQNSVTSETNARAAADTTLQNSITGETSARTAADTTLQTNITGETSARTAADTTLQNSITGETNARTAADTALQTSVTTEATTRTSADTTLQNNINTESSARAAADTALQTGVNARVTRNGDTMTGKLTLPTDGLAVGANQIGLAGGNVGIGTTTPSSKLQIVGGDISIDGDRGIRRAGDNFIIGFQTSLPGIVIGSGSPEDKVVIRAGAVERVRFDNNGNVGIGTTAPTSTLTVNGTAGKPGGGSWDVFSDERLKNIKSNFYRGLQAIMQLQPIRYQYKANNPFSLKSDVEHIGFSAQAVQKIIPEAVTQNSEGYLMINNDPILWTMMNAIKEQQAEIEKQRQLIELQQAQAKHQQEQVDALKRLVCRSHQRSNVCK